MPRSSRFSPVRIPGKKLWYIRVPAEYSNTEKAHKLYFKTRTEALEFGKSTIEAIKRTGTGYSSADMALLDTVRALLVILEPHGKSLREVVLEWVSEKEKKSPTIDRLSNSYEKQLHASERYVKTVHRLMAIMREALGSIETDRLTPTEFVEFLDSHFKTSVQWNNALRTIRPMFSYGIRMEMCTRNPGKNLQLKKVHLEAPRILTAEQAKLLLTSCENYSGDKNIPHYIRVDCRHALPAVAIMLFAGVRPTEITRLKWGDIDVKKRYIYISPKTGKTPHARYIHIENNLLAFLSSVDHKAKDSIVPENWPKKWQAVRKMAGIGDMQDVCRHSYASYWLAKWENMDTLLQNMGHTTSMMTLRHYRAAATKEDAHEFWSIVI